MRHCRKITLESELQSKILKDLRSLGNLCVCFKIEKANENGFPDIFFTTVVSGGVFVETKRPTGNVAKLQEYQMKRLIDCGSKAFTCYNWEEWLFIKKITKIDIYFAR